MDHSSIWQKGGLFCWGVRCGIVGSQYGAAGVIAAPIFAESDFGRYIRSKHLVGKPSVNNGGRMNLKYTVMLLIRYKRLTIAFAIMALVYLLQSLLATPDPSILHKYQISATQLHLVGLAVAAPYIVIWGIAAAGYLWLHRYAQSLKGTSDGDAFAVISRGVFWLLIWMPVASVAGGLVNDLGREYPHSVELWTILLNYFNLLLLLPGFIYAYIGSRRLLGTLRKRLDIYSLWLTLAFIAFAVLYTFLTLSDDARQTPHGDMTSATYYLDDIWIVLTVIIPRLISWFLGVQAVRNILLFRRVVKGNIYKAALNDLAYGIGGVLVFVVILRCIQSFAAVLAGRSLGFLLLLVYVLLAMIAASFVYVARGARRLRRIEEL